MSVCLVHYSLIKLMLKSLVRSAPSLAPLPARLKKIRMSRTRKIILQEILCIR